MRKIWLGPFILICIMFPAACGKRMPLYSASDVVMSFHFTAGEWQQTMDMLGHSSQPDPNQSMAAANLGRRLRAHFKDDDVANQFIDAWQILKVTQVKITNEEATDQQALVTTEVTLESTGEKPYSAVFVLNRQGDAWVISDMAGDITKVPPPLTHQ